MNAFQRMNTALMVDKEKQIFKVSRQTFVDPDILEAERARIFDKCWLYLGHSSELPKLGDFVTRQVGGRSILFARDAKGTLRAMLKRVIAANAKPSRADLESPAYDLRAALK